MKPIVLLDAINSVDKRDYLRKDYRLLKMLKEDLGRYNHFILTSTTKKDLYKTLDLLGIPLDFFTLILTFDDLTCLKPHPNAFKRILDFTKDLPETHVLVGDNERMDIIPSKKVGMKTIMVWNESDIADFNVESIYDVSKIIQILND